ncbi:unnamed protein product [Amoebophrya sp. A120]|nr:unnamed protein product [Amoebophrya sp. A120]|eukprot:GSA120T00024969001.1
MALPAPVQVTSEGWVDMHHCTGISAAESILSSRQFRAGTDGYLGGAIYFSKSYEEAMRRAQGVKNVEEEQVVLSARVYLGRCGHFEKGTIVDGPLLNQYKLNSAKVFGREDSYCLADTNKYRADPLGRVKWIFRCDDLSETETDCTKVACRIAYVECGVCYLKKVLERTYDAHVAEFGDDGIGAVDLVAGTFARPATAGKSLGPKQLRNEAGGGRGQESECVLLRYKAGCQICQKYGPSQDSAELVQKLKKNKKSD